MTTKTKATKYESTKALDELFAYGYRLRKLGLDGGLIKNIIDGFLVGAPVIAFNIPSEELSEDQKKIVEILEANGFEVHHLKYALVIKNLHLCKVKEEIDEYFKNK